MVLIETKLQGAYIIELEKIEDERGFFARTFCQREFEAHGLNHRVAQCSTSFNKKKGTLRGMHYQVAPHQETKLVRCTAGAIYDVAVDLRPDSPAFKQWVAVELTEDNRKALYIPAGCAHGFQALVDNTEVHYQISEFYHPEAATGIRWDDPAFGVQWPLREGTILSERDRSYADYSP
ncbi:MAG TPA: dTDP-4-dehydrorhamnose 3,5-epimerase [Terriglobia bacterium]|nr:dTDP-4-dehydrorhamnose 3,5-epimerase [Terriglobia bacterium]